MKIIYDHAEINKFINELKSLPFFVCKWEPDCISFRIDALREKSPILRGIYSHSRESMQIDWLVLREWRDGHNFKYSNFLSILETITDEKLKVQLLYHINLLDV